MSAPGDSSTAQNSSDETAVKPAEVVRVDPTVRFTPGTLLAGRYRIVSPLGKGGMGEVYRADDIRLGQPVALKFLSAAFAADSGRIERLVDEVRVGRQISHPNVCRLYDIAEAEGHHFLVMEYVDGEDLASLLRRIGRLPGDKALDIARGMCAGLAAAHDKGIIHRDLKPANVMIDGRGHARIADFGLAALAQSRAIADMSGTPQYMAPEQLTGEGASLRTDVYALGLVLHEMLTGKRVFEAKSLKELRALHADSKAPALSTSATDVDPGFDRVVQRCLARNPNDRPASAREVLLSLPGGDPLQAAILAGETPSPEMVAAAGKVGDIRPAAAWLGLAAGLVGLWALTAVSDRVSLFRMVSLPKSPEVLTERAQSLLDRYQAAGPRVDSAAGFLFDNDHRSDAEKRDRSLERREVFARSRPAPLRFYYRQSPRPMATNGWIPVLPWGGPPELGRITRETPPLTIPGMAEVVLDPSGSLVSLVAVPPRFDDDPGPPPEFNWSSLLAEAGLDPTAVRATAPRWAGPVESDRKVAWDGIFADRPEAPLHIEGAAYRGRPVYFEVMGPWVRPLSDRSDRPLLGIAIGVVLVVSIPLIFAMVLLVRRNLRMGRGDRRGAFRLALATFAALTLAQAMRADHTSLVLEEYALVVHIVSQGCYAAIALWSFYVALEPAVRRRWPHSLISWTRVLAGRFTDALVARDSLVGLVAGIAVSTLLLFGAEAPRWFGRPPALAFVRVLTTLNSPWQVAHYAVLAPLIGVLYSVAILLILYLLHALVKRLWLAQALAFLFACIPAMAGPDDLWATAVVGAAFAGFGIMSVSRVGLLCTSVYLATVTLATRVPLTLDASAWYAGRAFAVLGLFVLLLAGSAYLSLGGKPLFGKALLDD